jgi:hypothetical protein
VPRALSNQDGNQKESKSSLVEQLYIALKSNGHIKNYKFGVLELSDTIIITGTVYTYFHKQIASHTALDCLNRHGEIRVRLQNDIVVR